MTPQINQHLSANSTMTRKEIMVNNFLGGLSWGFGTVVGATIVAAIVISILRIFGFIPGINDLLNQTSHVKGIQTIQLQQ